jgi:hypothetical protein
MFSRRDFLASSGASAGVLLLPSSILVSNPLSRRGREEGIPRLGLFFDESELDRLRTLFRTESVFEGLKKELLDLDREAERSFYENEIRYNDHLYHINRVAKTAPNMAFLYAMTGDEDAAQLAIESVRQLMKFPKWDYFLEGGSRVFGLQRAPASTIAVSLCSDFLGDAISEEERVEWITTMGERGCEPCFLGLYGMRYKDRVEGWSMDTTSTYFEHRPDDRVDLSNWPTILDRTNLKAVPASALAVGAIAYEKVLGPSEDVDRWIEQAVYSVGTFRDLYAPDGSYDEGISYANYTSEHLAQAAEVLSRGGRDDVYDQINWRGFIDFVEGMSMATNADPAGIVNFGDAGAGMMSAVPFWVASRFGDHRGQWFGRSMSRGHNMWSMFWYEPEMDSDQPARSPKLYRSDLEWIVARTGYTPDDLVVAMRSGGPANHEHADRNGLIIKCFGEILVADPYRPPYSYADPSWILRTTAGHSALLIDGEGHQYHDGSEGTNASDAEATIIRSGQRAGYMFWVSDATPAYQLVNPDVASVTRTVIVLHGVPAVVLVDKVLKMSATSTIQARFYADNMDGEAEVSATDRTFVLKRPAARVVGMSAGAGGTLMQAGKLEIPEERAEKHPFVDASTKEASLEPMIVTLLLPQRTDMTLSTGRVNLADDGEVEVRIQSGLSPAVCRITDSGRIPEFRIEFG